MNALLASVPFKGFKTMVFGALVAVAPAALSYIGGVDWTSLGVSPAAGAAIGAVIMGLRLVTNTEPGKSA